MRAKTINEAIKHLPGRTQEELNKLLFKDSPYKWIKLAKKHGIKLSPEQIEKSEAELKIVLSEYIKKACRIAKRLYPEWRQRLRDYNAKNNVDYDNLADFAYGEFNAEDFFFVFDNPKVFAIDNIIRILWEANSKAPHRFNEFYYYNLDRSWIGESIKHLPGRSEEELKKIQQEEDYLKPDGYMTLSNTGSMQVKLVDGGDSILYRFSSGDPFTPYKEADIEWGYDEDDYEVDREGLPELRPYFSVKNTRYYLDQFMRMDYPRF